MTLVTQLQRHAARSVKRPLHKQLIEPLHHGEIGVAGWHRGWRVGIVCGGAGGARLLKAKACSATAIATLASGLDGDATAVRAALTEPWGSGQAEG